MYRLNILFKCNHLASCTFPISDTELHPHHPHEKCSFLKNAEGRTKQQLFIKHKVKLDLGILQFMLSLQTRVNRLSWSNLLSSATLHMVLDKQYSKGTFVWLSSFHSVHLLFMYKRSYWKFKAIIICCHKYVSVNAKMSE